MKKHGRPEGSVWFSFAPKVAVLVAGLGACAPNPSSPASSDSDDAGDSGGASDAGDSGGASDAACTARMAEDLTPTFAFSSDARGAFPPRPACMNGEGGSDTSGPGPGPDAGSAPQGPGPSAGGTGDEDASANRDNTDRATLSVPPPALNPVPNEYGTNADVVMPDTDQSILADDFASSLHTNGRHCETCHGADYSWSTTPAAFQARFDQGLPHFSGRCDRYATNETATENDQLEPIFRKRDAANSPLSDLSTPEARRRAYSLLLSRAVIRIGLPVPLDAEFELVAVDDPYRFASTEELSLFRRSPPMANLRFSPTIMWDGRETLPCEGATRSFETQAEHAITGHAEGDQPDPETLQKIVHAELGLYVAQLIHTSAGQLNEAGANGGPYYLAQAAFYVGINAFARVDPRGHAYEREVFNLYTAWRGLPSDSERNRARAQIAEGERLFDTRPFNISGVSGFNDELGRANVPGTCGACHNTPNVGTNSEGRLMDLGVSDASKRSPELPLYTFRNKTSGALRQTSDPGQGLSTGNWSQLDRFKVPTLRGLAGRAPYLHDGSAASLEAVIEYHDQRFAAQLTHDEKAAFVAFLSAL